METNLDLNIFRPIYYQKNKKSDQFGRPKHHTVPKLVPILNLNIFGFNQEIQTHTKKLNKLKISTQTHKQFCIKYGIHSASVKVNMEGHLCHFSLAW